MLKARNKKLSMILVLAMLMTMFAGLGVASASSTYSAIRAENVSNINTYLTSPKIQIDIPNTAALKTGDVVTIHFPSQLEFDNPAAGLTDPKVTFSMSGGSESVVAVVYQSGVNPGTIGAPSWVSSTMANVKVDAPANVTASDANPLATGGKFVAYSVGNNAVEIKIVNDTGLSGAGRLYVDLQNVKVKNTIDGDMTATIVAPGTSGFSSGTVTFGKFIAAGAGTQATIKSVVTMGDSAKKLDNIMIQETVSNSITAGEVIKLKLPSGFTWSLTGASANGAWAFPAAGWALGTADAGRTLTVTAPTLAAIRASEGRIYIQDATIIPNESVAKKGEVTISLFSDKGNVTDQDIVVAKYVDFGVVVEENQSKEVHAGWNDTELGSFIIEEAINGSIIPNRTVTLTLPRGVKWDRDTHSDNVLTVKHLKGTNWTSGASKSFTDSDRTLKYSLPSAMTSSTSKLQFEKLKVKLSPDFTGDIEITVAGSAGIEGKVKVAEVKAPIDINVDSVNNIVIGAQAQKIADITLVEPMKEAWKAETDHDTIRVRLPQGATFAKLPTVKVTEGDLEIDKVAYAEDYRAIDIVLDSTSSKPSTVKISDVYVTANRSVPEGDFKLSVVGQGSTSINDFDNALTELAGEFNVDVIASAVIAKVVTPAQGGGIAEFKVGSNIYYVGGNAKVMDVAPYIKGDRSYVPMRYVAEMLGAEVVWDDAARTVTLTKGDDVVVFTIGSASYTVNGEAMKADVAPEIANERTMLPARYVAEAFGATVGWDAGTQTVLIQQ